MPETDIEKLLNEIVNSLGGLRASRIAQPDAAPAITNQIPPAVTEGYAGNTPLTQSAATSAPGDGPELTSQLITQMAQLHATGQRHVDGLLDNTKALADNSASRASSSAQQTAVDTAKHLGLPIFASPIVGLVEGIAKLFKQDPPPAPVLAKYQMPEAVNFQGLVSPDGRVSASDYSAAGQARPYAQPQASPAAQNITVQVQAFDSKSFLDHSGEIAQAVRQALLENHALSDVVGDL